MKPHEVLQLMDDHITVAVDWCLEHLDADPDTQLRVEHRRIEGGYERALVYTGPALMYPASRTHPDVDFPNVRTTIVTISHCEPTIEQLQLRIAGTVTVQWHIDPSRR